MNARSSAKQDLKAPAETPLADFLTVCWMLAVMTVVLCEAGAGIGGIVLSQRPESRSLQSLVDVLLFAALVVGLGAVAFMPVLWRLRRIAPPKPIAWLAVVVGLAPIGITFVRAAL